MIIDSHCHYNLDPLSLSWESHWKNAQKAGVVASVVVGTDRQSSQTAIDLTRVNPHFAATVGFHPNYFETQEQLAEIEELSDLVDKDRVIAIGEIGLDYFRLSNSPEDGQIKLLQMEAFKRQLELAEKHGLPVCIHVRDKNPNAYFEVLSELKKRTRNNVPCILHCVSGPKEYIKEAIAFGAFFGIAANCTYPKNEQVATALALIPADKLLLETDAPFLPPQAHRGKVCEPAMIVQTVEYVLAHKEISLDQILSNTQGAFLDKIPV